MARIIQFDNLEIDFMDGIIEKSETEPLECIRECRRALNTFELEDDDLAGVLIYLAESYMDVGEYSYAAYELKRALACNGFDPEVVKLLVSCLTNINEAENRDTCIEYFHDLFQSGGDIEENSEVYSMAYNAFSFPDRIMSDDNNLYIVTEEEKKKRMVDEYFDLVVKGEHAKALLSIMNTAQRFPNDVLINEKLAYSYLLEEDFKSAKAQAAKIMSLTKGSSAAFFVYTGACMEIGVASFDDKIIDYAMDIDPKDCDELQRIIFTLDIVGRDDKARAFMDKSVEYYNTCRYMLMEAYFLAKDKDKKGAINKLRSVNALYGERSFALDYVTILEGGGRLALEDFGNIPAAVSMNEIKELLLFVDHAAVDTVSEEFTKGRKMARQLQFAVYTDEFYLVEKVLKKLKWWIYSQNLEYFQNLLVDDELVSDDMKTLILKYMLIKIPDDLFAYSRHNKVEDVHFVTKAMYNKTPLAMRKAYANAYAIACFHTMNFDTALCDSFYNLIDIIGGRYDEFKCVNTLSAIIAMSAYVYSSDDLPSLLVELHGSSRATFNKYMAELNKDNAVYSEDAQDERLYAQLSDIMKKFGVIDDIDIEYDGENKSALERSKEILTKTLLELGEYVESCMEDSDSPRKAKIVNMRGEPVDRLGNPLKKTKISVIIKDTKSPKGKVVHKKITKTPQDEPVAPTENTTQTEPTDEDKDPEDKE